MHSVLRRVPPTCARSCVRPFATVWGRVGEGLPADSMRLPAGRLVNTEGG
jgi:hypothetical protein